MRLNEISCNKILHAYCRFHTLANFNYPFHILFLNICYEIAFVRVVIFGIQTPKRLAREICLQIKNSKIPRKIHQETWFQKSSKILAKLEYMKYVVCTENFEGAGTL